MNDLFSMPSLGATPLPNHGWRFAVWAPYASQLELRFVEPSCGVPMERDASGYFAAELVEIEKDARYFYHFEDGRVRPDPASRFQPEGVHGPSQVVNLAQFPWTDNAWRGFELAKSVFYELHVGTFTQEGTFAAIIPYLPALRDLGITAIELMPVAQFPGSQNWGYDGVQPFAPQNSYGGPLGLQRLVDAAHAHGLGVTLDVVYNHLGPEGNYFSDFGPYFTDKYKTPWGQAINYDDRHSAHVRNFFIQNALYWLEYFHVDALRLDAIHGIFDFSATHFLAELQQAVDALETRLRRKLHLIAESDLNDARILRSPEQGGYGLHAQWSDDFHHSLHTLLTAENAGYYSDFGQLQHLAQTMRHGWLYAGHPSRFRRRTHGNSPAGLSRSSFVVCMQNHDQIGNRARGDRLSTLVDFETLKLAAGVTALAPFIPMLFMGEEYGETAPFQYFTSHSDAALIEAVRKGRREEFSAFSWEGEVPDPHDAKTFLRSKLNHNLESQEPHCALRAFYRELFAIRREYDLAGSGKLQVLEDGAAILMIVENAGGRGLAAVFAFAKAPHALNRLPLPLGSWALRLDSSDSRWRGSGSSTPKTLSSTEAAKLTLPAHSFVVLERQKSTPE